MRFHQQTLDLFGEPAHPLDPDRAAAAVRGAASTGVVFPAAVAEWYAVPMRSVLWSWYASCHSAAEWRPGGRDQYTGPDPADDDHLYPPDDGIHWWLNPTVRRDPAGWITKPILPLVCECQGVWEWGVVLDGSDDPPTVVANQDDGEWDICALSFSANVYALVFDNGLYRAGGVRKSGVGDSRASWAARRLLRERFRVEPKTRNPWGGFTERYSRPGQQVSLRSSGNPPTMNWAVWAADKTRLADLADTLDAGPELRGWLRPDPPPQADVEWSPPADEDFDIDSNEPIPF